MQIVSVGNEVGSYGCTLTGDLAVIHFGHCSVVVQVSYACIL